VIPSHLSDDYCGWCDDNGHDPIPLANQDLYLDIRADMDELGTDLEPMITVRHQFTDQWISNTVPLYTARRRMLLAVVRYTNQGHGRRA
jgi:hypothetical protein